MLVAAVAPAACASAPSEPIGAVEMAGNELGPAEVVWNELGPAEVVGSSGGSVSALVLGGEPSSADKKHVLWPYCCVVLWHP